MEKKLKKILELTKEITNLERERQSAYRGSDYERRKRINARLDEVRVEKQKNIFSIEDKVSKLPDELSEIVRKHYFQDVEWKVLYEQYCATDELEDEDEDVKEEKEKRYEKEEKEKVDIWSKKIRRKLKKF